MKKPTFNEYIFLVQKTLNDVYKRDYDWIRKYGNTFLSVSIKYLKMAMELNENNLPKKTS